MTFANSAKAPAIAECALTMLLLQALRIGAERLLAAAFAGMPAKMLTMCAMLILWLLVVA